MSENRCIYCDDEEFCTKYSNAVTVWKCNGCKEYEVENDKSEKRDEE